MEPEEWHIRIINFQPGSGTVRFYLGVGTRQGREASLHSCGAGRSPCMLTQALPSWGAVPQLWAPWVRSRTPASVSARAFRGAKAPPYASRRVLHLTHLPKCPPPASPHRFPRRLPESSRCFLRHSLGECLFRNKNTNLKVNNWP